MSIGGVKGTFLHERGVTQTIVSGTTKRVRSGFLFATRNGTRGQNLLVRFDRSWGAVLGGTAASSEKRKTLELKPTESRTILTGTLPSGGVL